MKNFFKEFAPSFILFCVATGVLFSVKVMTGPLAAETEVDIARQRLNAVITAESYLPVVPETLWKAYDSLNNPVGIVFRSFPSGYAGPIPLTVGLDLRGNITGILIGSKAEGFAETPGLGSKVARTAFTSQFIGRQGISAAIKKDGGDVDAVSGATISSRAVCSGIREGSEAYLSCLAVPSTDDMRTRALPGATEFVELIKDTLWLGIACVETVGLVFTGKTEGYLDSIKYLAGMDAAGRITGLEILYSRETAGIGEKIRDREFLERFRQGIPDAITGATISSQALINSVQKDMERFKRHIR